MAFTLLEPSVSRNPDLANCFSSSDNFFANSSFSFTLRSLFFFNYPSDVETPASGEVNFDAIHCVVLNSAASLRTLVPFARIALIRSMSEE
jgi:hypothetical protein